MFQEQHANNVYCQVTSDPATPSYSITTEFPTGIPNYGAKYY